MGNLKIVDTTLRDGHQSLWATRMTTGMMLPIAEKMDKVGFHAIDLMGMIQFDVCVRYLRENPWERIRLLKDKFKETPLQAGIRSKSLIGFDILPDDIIDLMIHRLYENGIRRIMAFDPLFDFSNIINTLSTAKKLGIFNGVALVYSISPVHTDELYVKKAEEIVRAANIDSIILKDPAGLLTPERVKTLIPAVKKVIGNTQLEVHTHCSTGLGPLVYLESVRNGADCIHTSIPPLANGTAQPSIKNISQNLSRMGFQLDIDDSLIEEVSEFLYALAKEENKPIGRPLEYDIYHYEHQMPGGMLTNLEFQLDQAGILNKYEQVLNEITQVRRELGWPIMVTPFAQLVVTQAVFNVIHGERYRMVPNEVKKYALGHYGKLLSPIEPNILDKIVENGSNKIPLKKQKLEGAVETIRKKYPNADDDERLLRYMISDSHVNEMLRESEEIAEYQIKNKSLVAMVEELAKRPKMGHIFIEKGPTKLRLNK